jgi:hypothetical protein
MQIHDTLQSEQSRPSLGDQFFGNTQGRFHSFICAMRESRQPRCTAAIFGIAATKAAKPLRARPNLSWTVGPAQPPAQPSRSSKRAGWHQVMQAVPEA